MIQLRGTFDLIGEVGTLIVAELQLLLHLLIFTVLGLACQECSVSISSLLLVYFINFLLLKLVVKTSPYAVIVFLASQLFLFDL